MDIKSKETDTSTSQSNQSSYDSHQQQPYTNVVIDKTSTTTIKPNELLGSSSSSSFSSSIRDNVTRSEPPNQLNGLKPEPVIINSVPSLKNLSENCLTVNNINSSSSSSSSCCSNTSEQTKMHLKTNVHHPRLFLQSKSLAVDNNSTTTNNSNNRPIYPNCPFSPYASPTNSPRSNRKRQPMRESRRVSIEKNGLYIQLNQYKLMDSIGQVINSL